MSRLTVSVVIGFGIAALFVPGALAQGKPADQGKGSITTDSLLWPDASKRTGGGITEHDDWPDASKRTGGGITEHDDWPDASKRTGGGITEHDDWPDALKQTTPR